MEDEVLECVSAALESGARIMVSLPTPKVKNKTTPSLKKAIAADVKRDENSVYNDVRLTVASYVKPTTLKRKVEQRETVATVMFE